VRVEVNALNSVDMYKRFGKTCDSHYDAEGSRFRGDVEPVYDAIRFHNPERYTFAKELLLYHVYINVLY
jgi:hypothetical protein